MRGLRFALWPIALALCVACGTPVRAQPADAVEAQQESKTSTPFIETEQQPAALAVIKAQPKLSPAAATRDRLKQILARPEFASGSAAPKTNWIERFIDWLTRALSRLGVKAPSWSGVVAITLVSGALIYLITRVIWEWQARRAQRFASEALPGEIVLGTDALLKAIADAVARGDYRAAIRLRFRWLLSALDLGESALLTNRQLVMRLGREHPAVREPLKQLVACFEDAWYGGLPCGQSDVALAASLAETVRDNAA